MDSKFGLQSGSNDIPLFFYQKTFRYIKDDISLLNLGCGNRFNFENEVKKIRKVSITSCDINNPEKIPESVDQFKNVDVENLVTFEKKFDLVTFFELIEHIDNTDVLLQNCYQNLKEDGLLIFSFPNLSSFYSRVELLLGFQPHILEASNGKANFGMGLFGRLNNPGNQSIHHIRGITTRAMKEMVQYHGFEVVKIMGGSLNNMKFFNAIYQLAPQNIFVCRKVPKK
jgi:SAM-dependent methyltransferase